MRLGAAFRLGAALGFAGALRFGAAFFLLLVAEIVVVGAMDVAANLRWRVASEANADCGHFRSKLVQHCSARDFGRTDRDGGKRKSSGELCGRLDEG